MPENGGALIVVNRDRQHYSGPFSLTWRIFVDEVWAADLKRGQPAQVNVTQGVHTVKVWSHGGGLSSNELVLTMTAASIRALRCRATMVPIGLPNIRKQFRVLDDGIRTGTSQTIVLWEP